MIQPVPFKKSLPLKFNFYSLIGTITLLSVTACERYDLVAVDFLSVSLNEIEYLSSDSLLIKGEVKDLESLRGTVLSYGIIASIATGAPLTIDNFEKNERVGSLSENDQNGRFEVILVLEAGRDYQIAAYATPDNERYFYSETRYIKTGSGIVFTEPVYYEGRFDLELRAYLTGIEKGLTVIQHGFCWSSTDDDPRFAADTVQLGSREKNGSFLHRIKVDSTLEVIPYYIRAYAIFRNSVGIDTAIFGDVTEFSGDLNFWTPIENVRVGGKTAATSFVINDKAYIGSGWQGSIESASNEFWEFYPAAPDPDSVWKKMPNFDKGSAPVAGIGFSIEGKGYFGLGLGDHGGRNQLWRFDPHPDSISWEESGSLPRSIESTPNAGVGFVIGDIGYFGTGSGPDGSNQNFFFRFIPRNNGWRPLPNFINSRSEATGFALNNQGYIGLGGSTDFYAFDPNAANPEWVKKADFPGPSRRSAICFVINDKAYVGAGLDTRTNEPLKDFYEFDPMDDSLGYDSRGEPLGRWFRRADLPRAFEDGVGFAIDDFGYAGLGKYQDGQYLPLLWVFNP